MSKKTLKFDDVEVNKKEFHASKKAIALDLIYVNKKVISGKFKHNDKGSKSFIGYKDDDIVRPIYIVLYQMSGNIIFFCPN